MKNFITIVLATGTVKHRRKYSEKLFNSAKVPRRYSGLKLKVIEKVAV